MQLPRVRRLRIDHAAEAVHVESARGLLVGKGGHAVRALETSTGSVIDVVASKGPAIPRRIRIEGSAAAIVKAKEAIADRLSVFKKREDRHAIKA